MTAEDLKRAIKEFEQAQRQYVDFGASDTEPDAVFQWVLIKHYRGEDYRLPADAADWELYSDMKGNNKAAKDLTKKLENCIKTIDQIKNKKEVRTVLEDTLWRVL